MTVGGAALAGAVSSTMNPAFTPGEVARYEMCCCCCFAAGGSGVVIAGAVVIVLFLLLL